jgi:hypothetical protein
MIKPFTEGHMHPAQMEWRQIMCTTTSGTLTLATLLSDPLIQAVMRSDGVSEREYEALLFRVKDNLAERECPSLPTPEWADA